MLLIQRLLSYFSIKETKIFKLKFVITIVNYTLIGIITLEKIIFCPNLNLRQTFGYNFSADLLKIISEAYKSATEIFLVKLINQKQEKLFKYCSMKVLLAFLMLKKNYWSRAKNYYKRIIITLFHINLIYNLFFCSADVELTVLMENQNRIFVVVRFSQMDDNE